MSREWTLRIIELPSGAEIEVRACTSGDNAKAWAKSWWAGCLTIWREGIRCEILDPTGEPWAWSDTTPNSHPLRMKWSWGRAPELTPASGRSPQ